MVDQLVKECANWVDIDGFKNSKAVEETRAAIDARVEFIYQGQLQQETELNGEPVRVMGYPDFLLLRDGGYTIGDAKLARSIYEVKEDGSRKLKRKKKYIVCQLRLYGWLFSNQFPKLECDLVVFNGAGEQERIDFPDDEGEVLGELEYILTIEALAEEPWEPVGWSKCSVCGFFDYCWPRARDEKALGYVLDIDLPLVTRLRDERIETYPELAAKLDVNALADLKSPSSKGKKDRNIAPAERILQNIQALVAGEPLRRITGGQKVPVDPRLLEDDHYVMFDLEGVPPDLDDWDKIYLWGMQVFGTSKGEFRPAFAGFGEGGDEAGWIEFLRIARELLDQYTGIHFIHWASYEETKIKQYLDRYPETDAETAREVLGRLADLLPITRDAVALPLPSYSLKVVEELPQLAELTGFDRSGGDVKKGDDSIVAYMEAAETNELSWRQELMQQLADYNQEDLEATWAVQVWLRHFTEAR